MSGQERKFSDKVNRISIPRSGYDDVLQFVILYTI